MKKTIWVIAITVVLVGGYFRVQKAREMGNTNPIKIGGLFALTGYAAFAGEASRDGFLMAIEDSGMDVPYVIEDFHSDLKTAVTAGKKLTEVDKVSVVIGPEWAEFGEVVAPLSKEKKIPFVSPWMVSEPAWLPSSYYFSGTASERARQKKLAEYMQHTEVKKIILVYSNNAWSVANVQMFKEELTKVGGVDVVQEFKFNMDTKDFRTEITKIKNINPDGIYSVIATDQDNGVFMRQLREFGLKYQVYLDNSRAESPVTRENFLNIVEGSIYPAPKEYKNAGKFEEKYEKRFGHKSGAISAAVSYDMTTLVLNAIKSGAKTPDEITAYLRDVKDYEGYSNTIRFNTLGQVAEEDGVIKMITKDGYKIIE